MMATVRMQSNTSVDRLVAKLTGERDQLERKLASGTPGGFDARDHAHLELLRAELKAREELRVAIPHVVVLYHFTYICSGRRMNYDMITVNRQLVVRIWRIHVVHLNNTVALIVGYAVIHHCFISLHHVTTASPQIETNAGGLPHLPSHHATITVPWHRPPFAARDLIGVGSDQKKKTAIANACIGVIQQYLSLIEEP